MNTNDQNRYRSGERSGGQSCIPCKKYEKEFCHEHSKDFILPDTSDDIKKLLCFNTVIRPDEAFVSGNRIEYGGELQTSVLFQTDSGTLDSADFVSDFSFAADLPEEIASALSGASQDSGAFPDGDMLSVRFPQPLSLIRLANPRKVNIKTKLCPVVTVFGELCVMPEINVSKRAPDMQNGASQASAAAAATAAEKAKKKAGRSDDMRASVYSDTHTITAAKQSVAQFSDIAVSDDIELDGALPSAEKLLYQNASALVRSLRPAPDGGFDISGEIAYSAVCAAKSGLSDISDSDSDSDGGFDGKPDGGKYFTVSKKIPFSTHLERQNSMSESTDKSAASECIAGIKLCSLHADIAENSRGEKKIIELDAVMRATVESAGNVECIVTSDLFSSDCECDISVRRIDTSELFRAVSTNFSVSAPLETDLNIGTANAKLADARIADAKIADAKIASVFGNMGAVTIRRDTERHRLTAEGNAQITCLLESLDHTSAGNPQSSAAAYSSVTASVPVKCELDVPMPDSLGIESSAVCDISNLRCRMTPSGISADFEVNLSALIFGISTDEIVDAATLDPARLFSADRPPLTLFYPEPNTKIYDIAKRYHVSPEAICEVNGIPHDKQYADTNVIMLC